MSNVAYLVPSSPFFDLFPNGVPIVNIMVPNRAELEGFGEADVYMVELERLSAERWHALADRIAAVFGSDVWDVRRDMLLRGLPLRASEVRGVSTGVPWFL